ncbi:hypothetical protein YC2023_016680 [Brassica napus]
MADLAKHVRVGAWRNIDHFCVSGAGNGSYRSTGHKYRLAIVGLLLRSSSNTSEICYTCHVNIFNDSNNAIENINGQTHLSGLVMDTRPLVPHIPLSSYQDPS